MKNFLHNSRHKTIAIVCVLGISSAYAMPKNIQALRKMYLSPKSQWQKPQVDSSVLWEELSALPDTPPYPESNPYSLAKAKLGEKLFFDPILSQSGQIACANCHDKELGFADGRSVSYGHNRQLGKRNAPSIVMSAFGKEKFWDGRAKDLESQALFPIADPKEMAYSPQKAVKRLAKDAGYKAMFKEAFGSDEITTERLAQAIATYERTLMPKNSRFDKFMKGQSQALSDKEVWGLHLFRTKGRCMNCHYGASFSDEGFHNLGLTYYGRKYEDLGYYHTTGNTEDIGKFKTPSLRNVVKTAPYMHNGLFPHLRGVLNAYNGGMFHPKPTQNTKANTGETKDKVRENLPYPKTDSLLKPLGLSSDEIEALEAFLKTL